MAEAGTLRVVAVAVLGLLLVATVAALLAARRPGAAPARPFLGHLEELRRRILTVLASALAAIVASLAFRIETVGGWPVPVPALYDSLAAQAYRAMAAHIVPDGVQLTALSPMEGFQAQFTVALGIAVVVCLPVLLHQLARFFGPALRDNERRMLLWALGPATALFALGAAFCYWLVLPPTMEALYAFSEALGATQMLRVQDVPATVLAFVLCFGVAFETPLVVVALARSGLVEGRWFLRQWRFAVLGVVAIAGILTPDPTLVSQTMLAVPLLGLYLLGALVAARLPDGR